MHYIQTCECEITSRCISSNYTHKNKLSKVFLEHSATWIGGRLPPPTPPPLSLGTPLTYGKLVHHRVKDSVSLLSYKLHTVTHCYYQCAEVAAVETAGRSVSRFCAVDLYAQHTDRHTRQTTLRETRLATVRVYAARAGGAA